MSGLVCGRTNEHGLERMLVATSQEPLIKTPVSQQVSFLAEVKLQIHTLYIIMFWTCC